MTSTLYLTRNGLLEPLGQSQVFAYLRGLAPAHTITLITHEKPVDWQNAGAMAEARAQCVDAKIDWQPRPFRAGRRVFGGGIDIAALGSTATRLVRERGVKLVHARSYLPAAVAWYVWHRTGVPFVFDMRALWPEELITAGRIKRGSTTHRAIAAIERACLRDAAVVVSLTHAAVDYLRETYPRELEGKAIEVIPTCADLDRFTPRVEPRSGGRVYGCIGTILSGWFRVDWLAVLFATAAARDPAARFDIVTRDDAEAVRKAVDPEGVLGDRLTIGGRRPQTMPDAVRDHDVSVMFYAGGAVSELGRSPTRLGEVLGCGLPVIANSGVGDVADIVNDNAVGVLAAGPSRDEMGAALDTLDQLVLDPKLPARCRTAAKKVFSLESGVAAYDGIYRTIASTARDVAK